MTDSMEASGDNRCNVHMVVAWLVEVSRAECIQSVVALACDWYGRLSPYVLAAKDHALQ